MKRPQSLFRIRFTEGGYYSQHQGWQGVAKEKATKMPHKQALRIRSQLRSGKIKMRCVLEEVR